MAKTAKKAPAAGESPTRRYRSVAEIKRDLFPNAAAAEQASDMRRRGHETLMEDFFGPQQRAKV